MAKPTRQPKPIIADTMHNWRILRWASGACYIAWKSHDFDPDSLVAAYPTLFPSGTRRPPRKTPDGVKPMRRLRIAPWVFTAMKYWHPTWHPLHPLGPIINLLGTHAANLKAAYDLGGTDGLHALVDALVGETHEAARSGCTVLGVIT